MATHTKGVLFDFDGVIVNSLPVHFAAWRRAVEEVFAIDPGPLEELYQGHATPAFAGLLATKFGDRQAAGTLAAAKIRLLREGTATVPLMPNVLSTFASLSERQIPYAIASNAPREFVQATLKAKNIDIAVALGREDAERGKPHPDLYLLAAKKLGLTMHDHRETLVFEDSLHGIKAGVRAGMTAIGVTSQHSSEELRRGGAIATCDDIGVLQDERWHDTLWRAD